MQQAQYSTISHKPNNQMSPYHIDDEGYMVGVGIHDGRQVVYRIPPDPNILDTEEYDKVDED